jgi:hypothetical protein
MPSDRANYYKEYKKQHIEHFKEKTLCQICGSKYLTIQKSRHMKGKQHKMIIMSLNSDDPDVMIWEKKTKESNSMIDRIIGSKCIDKDGKFINNQPSMMVPIDQLNRKLKLIVQRIIKQSEDLKNMNIILSTHKWY